MNVIVYLLSTYYVLGASLGTGVIEINKQELCLPGAHIQVRNLEN